HGGDREDSGPGAGHALARCRHQRYCFRRLRRRRRASGRPAAHQPAGRSLRERPQRDRQSVAEGASESVVGGPRSPSDRVVHADRKECRRL
ncbi:uncharacterized protein METZ01_LOCUS395838, partial [marine metagenome]